VFLLLRALVLLLAFALPAAGQETFVTGVSTDNIALTADFDGSEIFVFGAIRRDGPIPVDAGPLDVIIAIKGPLASVTVRRKARRLGIWVNTDAVRVTWAPSFYAVASTRPLDQILSETERLRHRIGMDQAVRLVRASPGVEQPGEFADALVRIRDRQGLYEVLRRGVTLTEDTLFQARFELPANIVEGDYSAEFYLVRDERVISSGVTLISVRKAGIERWIYNLAHDRPLAYGALAIALALSAGWVAATAFRLLRR
jgi:uncharacterized protein (TIGR02186 family)